MTDNVRCIVDGSKGQYVPQDFVLKFDRVAWGIDPSDWNTVLEGPHDFSGTPNTRYWDAWERILDDAQYQDENGDVWVLDHELDLFMRNTTAEDTEDLSWVDEMPGSDDPVDFLDT